MSSCCSLFLLVEGGRVHIRDWRDRKSSRADTKRKPVAPGALKTRPCWFYDHHPQRCPLQAEHCAFAHGPDDLRPSTKPRKKIKNDALWLIHLSTAFLINSRESPRRSGLQPPRGGSSGPSSKQCEFYWCDVTSLLGIEVLQFCNILWCFLVKLQVCSLTPLDYTLGWNLI